MKLYPEPFLLDTLVKITEEPDAIWAALLNRFYHSVWLKLLSHVMLNLPNQFISEAGDEWSTFREDRQSPKKRGERTNKLVVYFVGDVNNNAVFLFAYLVEFRL